MDSALAAKLTEAMKEVEIQQTRDRELIIFGTLSIRPCLDLLSHSIRIYITRAVVGSIICCSCGAHAACLVEHTAAQERLGTSLGQQINALQADLESLQVTPSPVPHRLLLSFLASFEVASVQMSLYQPPDRPTVNATSSEAAK